MLAAVFGLWSTASAEPFSYSGRLTEVSGKPLDGPVDLTVSFHTAATLGSPIGAPIPFAGVALANGVFQVDLDTKLTATQLRALFADPSAPVWVQVTVGSTEYPRQRFGVVPYALKVPIDNKTLGYDAQGLLELNTTDAGQAGWVLSTDGAGALSWIDISGLGGGGAVENQILNGEATKAPAQDAVFDALALKENAFGTGTTGQFLRGDKSWQTVVADQINDAETAVAPSQNVVFDALAARDTAISAKENAFAAGTTSQFLRGDKTWQQVVADSLVDGELVVAPSQNAVFDALATKEGTVTPGTSAQYYRGDKSWQTLDTATVPENGNLYFTAARAKTAAVADQINDGVADVAPSQNAVYDALATRDTAIAAKENAFGAGTTAQYLRGDKTWQTLSTAGVPESGNLYFTNARAQGAAVGDQVADAVTNVAPSQNAVFDALAAKEAAFAAGTTLQYLRGDKSWQTLDTTAVAEGTNLYYTDARARAAAVADATTDGVTDVAASQNAVFDGLALKQSLTQKNAANGYAGLDASGKLLPANLPYAGLAFKGTWDAGTNTPTLTSGACGTSGDYYITAAGGATDLNGITTWSLGDWAICGTGNVWTRVGNPSGAGITTVNGLTGATINLITDNINEGSTNLYFSNARAKSAAVSNTITDGVNDVAPSQNAVFDALALKEGSLSAGATSQYFRGDKTWQTLNTQNVTEHASNLYFTNGRAQSAAVADQIVDATTTVAPSQNAVFDALAGKEPSITSGTAAQYFRGDKTWQTLSTTNVTEGTNQYFTTARAKSAAVSNTLTDGVTDVAPSQDAVFDALATRDASIGGKEPAITAGTTAQFWRGDKTWQTVVQDSVSDGVTAVAPSQNAVFDLLATKSSTSHGHSSLDASDGSPTQALTVDANGNVGVGTTAPGTGVKFEVRESVTDAASSRWGSYSIRTDVSATNGTRYSLGAQSSSRKDVQTGITDSGYALGHSVDGYLTGAGTLQETIGIRAFSGTMTGATGTVASAKAIVASVLNQGGAVTIGYGVLIPDVEATTGYGLWSAGANDVSYFAGNVGIGSTNPQGKLDVGGSLCISGDCKSSWASVVNSNLTSPGPIGGTAPNTGAFTTLSSTYTNTATSGTTNALRVQPTYNQSSSTASNTDLLINRTETAVGSGTQRLIDAQVGGATKFNVSNTGDGYFAGKLGIGSTAPGVSLDVNGQIDSYDTNARIRIAPAAFGADKPGIRTTTDDSLSFGTNDTRRMTISNTGNIGINTESPGWPLHLKGASGAYSTLFIDTTDANTGSTDPRLILGEAGTAKWTIGMSPTTDRFRISEVGVGDHLSLIPGGNLGLGTATPVAKLHVESANEPLSVQFQNAGQELNFLVGKELQGTWPPADSALVQTIQSSGSSAGHLALATGNHERMRITTTGSVGIGTTNPLMKLHLATVDSGASVLMDSMTNSGNSQINFRRAGGTTASPTAVAAGYALGGVAGQGYDGSAFVESARILFNVDATPGANDMPTRISFQTTPDGSATPAETMRLSAAGNLGVGTTNPLARLHVEGGGAMLNGAAVWDTAISGMSNLSLVNNTAGAGNGNFGSSIDFGGPGQGSANGPRAALVATQDGSDADNVALAVYTHPSATGTDPLVEAMRVASNGNLGVGTTNPGRTFALGGTKADEYMRISTDSRNWDLGIGVTSGDDKFLIYDATAGASRVTIDTSGNVGIGSTAPTQRLDVGSGLVAMGWERIQNTCNNPATTCTASCTGSKRATGGGCQLTGSFVLMHQNAGDASYSCVTASAPTTAIIAHVYCANIR